jgi:alanine racemase
MRDCSANYLGGRLRIDLGALVQNYRLIVERVEEAEVGAVVKADAYGLGAQQVAKALYDADCRLFFVANIDEALRLRESLAADAEILMLNGLPKGAEALCTEARIVPVLNSIDEVRLWRDAGMAVGRRLPAAIQFDSGMARLGITLAELQSLVDDIGFETAIEPVLVMSHLACSDIPEHPANIDQLARFQAMAAYFPATRCALANSGGAFLPAGFHFDVVRAGIALYGGAPNVITPNPMLPVVSLDARIMQVRTVPAGSGVGYGYDFRCDVESRIATIGVGYADGLPRTLGNRGAAWVGGKRMPIVGRVSMDSITIDVTTLPPDDARPGDWVELIGPNQPVDALAQDARTISYEILTGLGARYHRSYLDSTMCVRASAS